MAPLRRLTPGEMLPGIPADTWNKFCDTWQRVFKQPPPGNGNGQVAGASRLTMEIFNTTGADITADFPVLAIEKPSFTTDDSEDVVFNHTSLDGDTPDEDTTTSQIAIVQGPISDGESRSAVITGPTWVKVEFTSTSHTHAAPKADDDTKLTSAASGITILWHEEIPEEEYLPADLWCYVLLGGGGGGTVEARGVVGITVGEITAMTSKGFDELDSGVQEAIDPDELLTDEQIYLPGSGDVDVLAAVEHAGQVYLIPTGTTEEWLNTTWQTVGEDKIVQGKRIGGHTYIDVEACD